MYRQVIMRQVREQRILHDVSLELTYACNLDCFYCYNDREKKGKPLSLGQYRVLLNDLAEMQTLYLMLTGGEPMIHPHFFDIGRMAKTLGFVVRIRTNGHNLSPRMIEKVLDEVDPYIVEVSLHGATRTVHDRQTRVPGSFDRLMKNITASVSKGLRISAVATPTVWNQHQIIEMFTLCDAMGVPLRFQGPVAPRDNGDRTPLAIQPDAVTWDKIVALQNERRDQQTITAPGPTSVVTPGMPKDPPEVPATCSVGVSGVDIDPYGNVKACMHLQEPAGNLHDQNIGEIWHNAPLFQRARNRAVEAAKQFTIKPPKQLGAPLFCIAVQENLHKGNCGQCHNPCK